MSVSRAGRFTLQTKTPYWKYVQAKRARLQASVAQMQQDAQITGNAFANAVTSQISGTAELAVQASLKRMQNEIQLARQGLVNKLA